MSNIFNFRLERPMLGQAGVKKKKKTQVNALAARKRTKLHCTLIDFKFFTFTDWGHQILLGYGKFYHPTYSNIEIEPS